MSDSFRHEAVFYRGDEEFLAGTVDFIREGVAAGEPVMVAVDEQKIALLREELGGDDDAVRFVEMGPLGRNPARIIPVWREFVADAAGRPMRGIGEPVWPGRSDQELEECDHHESLLNLAFAEAHDFKLLCPYDADGLDGEVLAAARRNHPWVSDGAGQEACADYVAPSGASRRWPAASRAPRARSSSSASTASGSPPCGASSVRPPPAPVSARGGRATSCSPRASWPRTASSTAAAAGEVRVWREPDAFVCEVADRGRIDDALVGRRRPSPDQMSGRGLWIVNQVCDLVQVRSCPEGSVVRVRIEPQLATLGEKRGDLLRAALAALLDHEVPRAVEHDQLRPGDLALEALRPRHRGERVVAAPEQQDRDPELAQPPSQRASLAKSIER